MGLVADSAELSLLDLVQVKGLSRATCQVVVNGRQGKGLVYLRGGELVQASYGGLAGAEAVYALLAEPQLGYRVTRDVPAPAPDMQLGYQYAILEAMRRLDEAGVHPEPSPPEPAAPRHPEAGAPSGRRFSTVLLSGLAAAGAAVLVGAGLLLFTRDLKVTVQSGPAAASAAEPREARAAPEPDPGAAAIEASAFAGPGVSLPVLVSGAPPPSPDPSLALKPTVICRLLVDRQGAVSRAEVFQRRPDLDRFEAAALAAVRQYRFQPARRDGAAVPAWINWPVDFI